MGQVLFSAAVLATTIWRDVCVIVIKQISASAKTAQCHIAKPLSPKRRRQIVPFRFIINPCVQTSVHVNCLLASVWNGTGLEKNIGILLHLPFTTQSILKAILLFLFFVAYDVVLHKITFLSTNWNCSASFPFNKFNPSLKINVQCSFTLTTN